MEDEYVNWEAIRDMYDSNEFPSWDELMEWPAKETFRYFKDLAEDLKAEYTSDVPTWTVMIWLYRAAFHWKHNKTEEERVVLGLYIDTVLHKLRVKKTLSQILKEKPHGT